MQTREARVDKFHFRVSGAYDKAIDCKFDSIADGHKLQNVSRARMRIVMQSMFHGQFLHHIFNTLYVSYYNASNFCLIL